ncbi:MAG: hypothetical protein A2X34_06015 [Elusimicrobia bacterium GWC2_51_8]|nr:MAG: hypothetical protein A2X34_06015 [Elusimicrobia bacterium GWC2_51_8]
MGKIKILCMVILAAGAVFAAMEGYRYITASISKSAVQKSKRRIAVIGFSSETGRKNRSSAIVTERLTVEMASNPKIEVIERAKLDQVLEEQNLHAKGVMDQQTTKKIGHILGVDAVVMGTVINVNSDEVEINARLVDTQNAQVLKAVTKTVRKDWDEGNSSWDSMAMNMDVDPENIPSLLPDTFKELDWDSNCRGYSLEEVKFIELAVDFKAKKTALEVKKGTLDPQQITRNPGSEIKNDALRKIFYNRLTQWHKNPELKNLNPKEEALVAKVEPLLDTYPCRQ